MMVVDVGVGDEGEVNEEDDEEWIGNCDRLLMDKFLGLVWAHNLLNL